MVAALACLLAPSAAPAASGSALASSGRAGGDELSPRLAKLARPSVRSAPVAVQADKVGLPAEGPGSLVRDGRRALVEVRFSRGAVAGAGALRTAGAETVDVSRRYQTVTVAALPAKLAALSRVPRVSAVTEVLTPIASASTCPSGGIVSEGDAQLRATEARTEFGVDGQGVEVGILSDSFDQDGTAETGATVDAESGDLPGSGNTCTGQSTPVDVLEDFDDPDASDEGRAMAQIVHDLAPGAQISFATAFTGLTAFAGNIEDLAAAGADVIVDDVAYFEEPFFQEGPVGVAVSNVIAGGADYFSSAGNNNLISGGKGIASWEAPGFRATSCPAGVPSYATECMDFNPGAATDPTLGLTVSAGATLILDMQWAQPWNGVSTDLDAYLLNAEGVLLDKSELFNVTVSERPFEFIAWENTTGAAQNVRLAINRCDLACDAEGAGDSGSPRLKVALLQNGAGVTASEYPQSTGGDIVGPTIFGHNGAADAVSVGAVRYSTTTAPENFSSRGPVTHYFEPADGVAPAAPLASAAVLSKPDVAATDGGANTFFGPLVSGVRRFFGTSASAPHAAAVAALMLQEVPTASPGEIRTGLVESAVPVGTAGPCAIGGGLVDAVGAIEFLLAPTPASKPPCTPPLSPPVVEDEPPPTPSEPGGGVPTPTSPTTAAPRSAKLRRAPATFFRRRPAKILRTEERLARAVFRFGSNEAGVAFLCKLDRGTFRPCRRRIVLHLAPGPHVMRVKARDADGNTDRTPAVYRFRVERVEG
ncbi:MAG TPA: S8 family serine peptidase [Solirubrobacterales bacterium]